MKLKAKERLWVDPTPADGEWIMEEFGNIDLADKRRNDRFRRMASQFMRSPQASIPQACTTLADTKAAYRLLHAEATSTASVIQPHRRKTAERASGHEVVLSVQDTMDANFSTHEANADLGHIGTSYGRNHKGLLMHSAYLFTPEGYPLGLASLAIWSRRAVLGETKDERRVRLMKTPLEQKEAYKWVLAQHDVNATLAHLAHPPRVVTITDREGDIYEYLWYAKDCGNDFIVRAKQTRQLLAEDSGGYGDLQEALVHAPVAGQTTITVLGNHHRPTRKVTLDVRYATVTLQPPPRLKALVTNFKDLEPIEVNVVWACEASPRNPKKALSWVLLVSEPVKDAAAAILQVERYSKRWPIEVFHKVLKSGCRVETCRLEDGESLANYIAVNAVVAHRLVELTYASRLRPDANATEVLSDAEWKALYIKIKRTNVLPEGPPTLRQAIRWIAQLGGFLGRKGDGEPGPTTLWRGWQVLMPAADMYRLVGNR
jgi:hypothetical protein